MRRVIGCSRQDWHMGSLLEVPGLSSWSTWAQLPCGMWDLSSPTRNWTCIPYIGRQICNHWTKISEVPLRLSLEWSLPLLSPLAVAILYSQICPRIWYLRPKGLISTKSMKFLKNALGQASRLLKQRWRPGWGWRVAEGLELPGRVFLGHWEPQAHHIFSEISVYHMSFPHTCSQCRKSLRWIIKLIHLISLVNTLIRRLIESPWLR